MDRAADVAAQVADMEAAEQMAACLVQWGCDVRVVQYGASLIVLGYARVSP